MDDRELLDRLGAFITPHKRALFDRLAPQRTRHVTVVLEDLYQAHNASAVLRTCDLLGIQEVHAIEAHNRFTANKEIALGSDKWATVHRYAGPDGALACIGALRASGHRIVATTPHAEAWTPEDVPIDRPIAFCFGTELHGLSDTLLGSCDGTLRIPMHGFTESYNISVSAAIVLYTVMTRLRRSTVAWQPDEATITALKLQWTRAALHDATAIEQRLRTGAP
ncbi:MAG: RNA methyltransferase [Flavobacteriales bacterium]|nr:23S rRNA (guanosine-2'-O-)-methyltransferase RlmB [Flavobacteriales bacterium]MCC6578771.1 RNA methyltransferase [Flavobacteriales bacterium]NUQ13764.1 RNA methyltransferase [Flavobacteriales bacterium]